MKIYPTNSRVLIVPKDTPTYGVLEIPVMQDCLYGLVTAIDVHCPQTLIFNQQLVFFQNCTGNNIMYDKDGKANYLIDYRDIIATVEQ